VWGSHSESPFLGLTTVSRARERREPAVPARQPAPGYPRRVFTREQAHNIAQSTVPTASLDGARETLEGWYFPLATDAVGSSGVIVHKRTGRVLELGSAYPVERDIALYDKGYQFKRYDLVITSVAQLEATVATLQALRLEVVNPAFEHGKVWRIARPMSADEIRARLRTMPCVFGDLRLYFVAEHLEAARDRADFAFELFEYRAPA